MKFEPTFSMTAVEGMFHRAVAGRMTPVVKAQLKEIGLDLDRPLLAAYSQPVWERGVHCMETGLYEALPVEQAYFDLGRLYVVGLQATLLGSAASQLVKLIGPERALKRLPRTVRASNNFTTLEVEQLAERHFLLHSGVVPEAAPYMLNRHEKQTSHMLSGTYTGLLGMLGVRGPQVTFREVDPSTFRREFDLRWEP